MFLLALVFALLAHDQWAGGGDDATAQAWPALLAVTLPPKLIIGGVYELACAITRRRRGARTGVRWLRRLRRLQPALLGLLLLSFVTDLSAGLLLAVRGVMGDWVLVDEAIVLAPTLAVVVWMWWAYYPIDRHVRESPTIRLLDDGQPVPPIWTRGQYLLNKLWHEVALVLLPMLALLAWMDALGLLRMRVTWPLPEAGWWLLQLTGVAAIMLLAPLVIRHVWSTTPLPAGPLRERLVAMCRTHRVGVRELLLWHTFGGMINAAVMGLISPVRYILLTDALLDLMPQKQVEAVMAHELAHVRRHHLFWLILAAMALGGSLELGAQGLLYIASPGDAVPTGPVLVERDNSSRLACMERQVDAARAGALQWTTDPRVLPWLIVGPALAAWGLAFGWVSRRFERQADTFAVQHLVHEQPIGQHDAAGRRVVDAASAQIMVDALQAVADLNHIDPRRRSWRHGSIAWRQDYLRSLAGLPVNDLPIDRIVRRINTASLVLACVLGSAALWLSWLV